MLQPLVSRCQNIAGLLLPMGMSSTELADSVDTLLDALPLTATPPQRLMVHAMVTSVLGRVVATAVGRQEAATDLVTWTTSAAWSDSWRADLCSLIQSCSSALRRRSHTQIVDSRLTQALRLLDTRFHDASLTSKSFASELRLSPWYATRLLKRQTGKGFAAHVHNRRIQAALQMLRRDRLSVKEIAVAVGYTNTTQLGRHFKRLVRHTPIEYRRSVTTAQSVAWQKGTTHGTNRRQIDIV